MAEKITLQVRVLQRAAELIGGQRALARRLRVPLPTLFLWVKGLGDVPQDVFIRAVDVLIEFEDPLDLAGVQDLGSLSGQDTGNSSGNSSGNKSAA